MEHINAASTFKAPCPRCNGERNCKNHGSVDVPWDYSSSAYYTHGRDVFTLAQCCGCDTVFMHIRSWDSEDAEYVYDPAQGEEVYEPVVKITTLPAPENEVAKTERPDWLWEISKADKQLGQILNEMYQAYDSESLILASIGIRTAFDRATEVLKVDPGHTLDEKINKLKTEGFIGETEARILSVLADAGGAAAHRAWSPDEKEFKALLSALEQFLQRTIISGNNALAIAEKIPPRQPRPKKTKPEPPLQIQGNKP